MTKCTIQYIQLFLISAICIFNMSEWNISDGDGAVYRLRGHLLFKDLQIDLFHRCCMSTRRMSLTYYIINPVHPIHVPAYRSEKRIDRERERESSTLLHGPKHTYAIAHLYCTLWREGTPHPALKIPVLGAEAVPSTWFVLPSLIFTAVLLWVPVHTQSECTSVLQRCYK